MHGQDLAGSSHKQHRSTPSYVRQDCAGPTAPPQAIPAELRVPSEPSPHGATDHLLWGPWRTLPGPHGSRTSFVVCEFVEFVRIRTNSMTHGAPTNPERVHSPGRGLPQLSHHVGSLSQPFGSRQECASVPAGPYSALVSRARIRGGGQSAS